MEVPEIQRIGVVSIAILTVEISHNSTTPTLTCKRVRRSSTHTQKFGSEIVLRFCKRLNLISRVTLTETEPPLQQNRHV